MLPGIFNPMMAGVLEPITSVTFIDNYTYSGFKTSHSQFGSFGAAHQHRVIAVLFHPYNYNPTSVIIAGITAQLTTVNTFYGKFILAMARVPTGTTGTISINFSGNATIYGAHIFRIIGPVFSLIPTASAVTTTMGWNPITAGPINIEQGGIALGMFTEGVSQQIVGGLQNSVVTPAGWNVSADYVSFGNACVNRSYWRGPTLSLTSMSLTQSHSDQQTEFPPEIELGLFSIR